MMMNVEIYDIFHDECKEDGYWHSFIFIPRSTQQKFLSFLIEARENLNYFNPIHFTSVTKKSKPYSEKTQLIKSWTSILYYALQEQKINADLYLGNKDNRAVYKKIKGVENKIGAKLVVLCEKDCLKKMFSSMSYSKKVEATFRMGLKGGCHFLFKSIIKIGNIYVDHPENKLNVNYDVNSILQRLGLEFNNNISFNKDSQIYAIDKRNYIPKDKISEFMQLADISVGAIRTRALQIKEPILRYEITYPLDDLFEKDLKNKARMKNSRFLNSFSLSDAWIEDGSWKFDEMKIVKEDIQTHPSFWDNDR